MSNDTLLEDYSLTLLLQELKSQSSTSSNSLRTEKNLNSSNAPEAIIPIKDRFYSGRQLMKRFKCGDRLLKIKRSQPDFRQWSQQRDPEDIPWQYIKGKFVPVQNSHVCDLITPVENRAYSVRKIMKRFRCGDRLLKIKRSSPDFTEWIDTPHA